VVSHGATVSALLTPDEYNADMDSSVTATFDPKKVEE
jgi:hypothetical protein